MSVKLAGPVERRNMESILDAAVAAQRSVWVEHSQLRRFGVEGPDGLKDFVARMWDRIRPGLGDKKRFLYTVDRGDCTEIILGNRS